MAEIFNNREIAAFIWVGVLLAWVLSKETMRQPTHRLFASLFNLKILTAFFYVIAYIIFAVIALHTIGLWDVSQLKATIYWTLMVGIASLFRMDKITDDDNYFVKAVKDQLAILVVLEFLVGLYPFNLFVELILLPFLTIVAALAEFSKHDEKNKAVKSFLEWILALSGLAMLARAINTMISKSATTNWFDVGQDFITPILLFFAFLPFIYGLKVLMVYQRTFQRIKYSVPDKRVARYARWQAAHSFGVNFESLSRWTRDIGYSKPKTDNDITASIKRIVETRAKESWNTIVPPEKGWAPMIAKDFLQDHGYKTNDYHDGGGDGEWWARTTYIDVGEGFLPNNIAYYIYGSQNAVTKLQLTLNVNAPKNAGVAEQVFHQCGVELITQAININASQRFDKLLEQHETLEFQTAAHKISLKRDLWKGGIKNGYEKTVVIELI